MKFIHVSNVKLNLRQEANRFGIDSNKERYDELYSLISYCNTNEIDALFITGNLFAMPPELADLTQLDTWFSNLRKTKVFILPGRHEGPGTYEGYPWESSVIIFPTNEWLRVYCPSLDAEILGVGYSHEFFDKEKRKDLPLGDRARYQICLLPTDIAEEETMNPEFDYIGLGGPQVINGERDNIYSPGDFAPVTFTNRIRHGFLAGELTSHHGRNHAEVQFVKGACREYVSVKLVVNGDMSYEEVRAKLTETVETCGKDNFYRVNLHGTASMSLYFNRRKLYSVGNVVEIFDLTNHEDLTEQIRTEHKNDAVGLFVKELLPENHRELEKKAMEYGVKALLAASGKEPA